jgi:uncharacterized protein (DUF433 family)
MRGFPQMPGTHSIKHAGLCELARVDSRTDAGRRPRGHGRRSELRDLLLRQGEADEGETFGTASTCLFRRSPAHAAGAKMIHHELPRSVRSRSAHLGGEPVFKGTRVTLKTVLASLAEGATIAEILGDFPTLSEEDGRAAMALARPSARRLGNDVEGSCESRTARGRRTYRSARRH